MVQMRTGDQALVKELNKAIVLNILRSQSPISRAAISKVSGLNKATVSALVDELAAGQLVLELGPGESSGGRRPNLLMLNDQAGLVAGVEIGVGHLLVVLLDLRAKVVWRRRLAQPPRGRGPGAYLDLAASLITEGLNAVATTPLGLLGVGVGVPGLVDHARGRLIFAPNLHWQEIDVAGELHRRLGVPVFVDNEANAGAVGELWAGCATAVRSLIYLSVDVGLGAGIIMDREVYRGAGGVAGELGHTTIDINGPVCSCGNRGCWEMYASGTALRARLATRPDVTIESALAAARDGDAAAISALSVVGEYLGVGIANVVNAFNPTLVVIGGSLAEGGSHVLNPARRAVEQRALAYPRSGAQIVLSALGAEACAIGAGALVLQDWFRLPALVG